MAAKQIKNQIQRVNGHRRRPGESASEWTVRTAYLQQNKQNGRWSFVYTEVTDGPDGKATYRQTPQSCFTTDPTEASQRFAQWKQARLNPDPATRTKPMSFTDLATHYLRAVARDAFQPMSRQRALKQAMEYFANDPATMITTERLNDFHDHMVSLKLQTGTVRQRTGAVLTVLRHGIRHRLVPAGALPTYRLPPVPRSRQYVLTPEQESEVFRTAADLARSPARTEMQRNDRDVGLFMCIAVETAARREAILRLTWDRIDLTPGREAIDFRRPGGDPRNKRAAVVPISRRLLPVIQHAVALTEPPARGALFRGPHGRRAFQRVRRRLGLPDLTPHVFRHTWATLAIRRGMPLALVAKVMADDVATIMKTYAHLFTDDARDAIERYMTPPAVPPPSATTPPPPPGPGPGPGASTHVAAQ